MGDRHQPRLIADDSVVEISSDIRDRWESEAHAVAVSGCRLVREDGPEGSNSSDEGDKPEELDDIYALGCSEGDAKLDGLEAFILRKASQGDIRGTATLNAVQGRVRGRSTQVLEGSLRTHAGRAGGLVTVSVARVENFVPPMFEQGETRQYDYSRLRIGT
jgi:hypothetical protein